MNKRKLLIVDSSEDFQHALSETLPSTYQVKCCCDGKEGLAVLLSYRPDILVLDLMIPNLDGLSLLQAAFSAGIVPTVITITKFYNDYMLHALTRLNVGYIMLKPCDISAVVNRIRDLEAKRDAVISTPPDPNTLISEILLKLGFVTKHQGYTYLRDAILCYAANPQQSFTKELYPTIARVFQSNTNNVERSIRTAIEAAWKRGNPEVWARYFPVDPGFPATRPTNSNLIARLANELRGNR